MLKILILLLFVGALAGCHGKEDGKAEREKPIFSASDFTALDHAKAWALASLACTGSPLLVRSRETELPAPPEFKGTILRETLQASTNEPAAACAKSPTNLWLSAEAISGRFLELPLPFDASPVNLETWKGLKDFYSDYESNNVFVAELMARYRILAPQRFLSDVDYALFRRSWASLAEIGNEETLKPSLLWARAYQYLRDCIEKKNFAKALEIAGDSQEIEGESAEWHAMMAEALRGCDPTRRQEILFHYEKAMELYAKRSKGAPYYRVWIEMVGYNSMQESEEEILAEYNGILASLAENQAARRISPEQAKDNRERVNRDMALFYLRYDDSGNAFESARRLLVQNCSMDTQREGMRLLFKAAERNGGFFQALAEYDKLIEISIAKKNKIDWLLEKGAVLMRYDLPVEASETFAAIEELSPGFEEEQLSMTPERQDVRFMRLYHYVRRNAVGDSRETALNVLRRRGILNSENASYYIRQVANLLVCMQRTEEALLTYEKADKDDNVAMIERCYLLYRNSRYEQCLNKLRQLPYFKGGANARDWRVITMRLFRTRKVRPEIGAVLEDLANYKDEMTEAAMLNSQGAVYQAYRQFDKAAECFEAGIKSDPSLLDNYLDRGFLYCMSADKEKSAAMLDRILALPLSEEQKWQMRYDWRAIELYFTAEREMEKEKYE